MLCIPGVIFLLYNPQNLSSHIWAGCLFGLALITDFFDGLIARRTKTSTPLGKIMDPVADKLMIIAGLIMILHLKYLNPIWVFLLIGREVVVNSLRTLAGQYDIAIPSVMTARIKVFTEGFGVAFIMGGPHFKWLGLPWYELAHISIYLSVILALWSGGYYFFYFYRFLKTQRVT